MKMRKGTMLFSLTFKHAVERIKSMNGEHPDWRYTVKRTGYGLWCVTII